MGRVAGRSTSVPPRLWLPTLNVRPFWPFQVVESGLWEGVGERAGPQGEWRLGPVHIQLWLCAMEPHLPEEGRFFSLTQKGSMGRRWL